MLTLSQSAVLPLNEHRRGVGSRNRTAFSKVAASRPAHLAHPTHWHAPKDLNPDRGGWSSECCRYTRDV
jgi:hypothetical protein